EEGQTFADYIGKPILPSFISVEDDPTLLRQGDISLNGHYRYDDQGVPAQTARLVTNGVLKGFLLGRRPVAGFDTSNGHGRAQGIRSPVARMGNLIVTADKVVTKEALRQRLLAEAKANGRPYGLIIRDVSGGATNTSSYGFQAFKAEAHMVYRVDALTGAEELVRGVDLVGTPLASLSKILAAGDGVGVFNGYCNAESGMIPVSTVAPAVLFSEVELQRSARGRSRAPILPAP
ncbi:MAG: metallopeptidase TldD-related protein, partial [Myxococcota bacterium]|nr:metallopeptidase TldD-related protein [Myxococcota bacterium]